MSADERKSFFRGAPGELMSAVDPASIAQVPSETQPSEHFALLAVDVQHVLHTVEPPVLPPEKPLRTVQTLPRLTRAWRHARTAGPSTPAAWSTSEVVP